MVTTPITIAPAFAVPFATLQLPDCAALNNELETLFLERETAHFRNPTPSHIVQREVFESRFNLFAWPEPCVQRLRAFVLEAVTRTALQASGTRSEQLRGYTLHNHTWFHITRYAGTFVAHNHPFASWSAVYCVRPGERSEAHPSSGLLRFFDTRHAANSYQDPGNSNLLPSFALGPKEVALRAGDLVVFPSYVFHEVTPFYGTDTRITVASNCWFA
jgi:hypothetical protein